MACKIFHNWSIAVCVCFFVTFASGVSILRHDEHHLKAVDEPLDPNGKYLLSWEVDLDQGLITFEARVETEGYVGFGISPSGGMAGADIFIAGVFPNKTTYAYDMYAEGAGKPSVDEQEDWTLEEASEEDGKTTVKFSRKLNTCDDKDYPIANDTVRLIWSIGTSDDLEYHGPNKGTKSVNLLMPDPDDFDPELYEKWDIETKEMEIPSADTTYWCNIIKAPNLTQKHHIIAFEPLFQNELAVTFTHHFIIYKCIPPEGQTADQAFGEFVDHPGEQCYLRGEEQPLPTHHCLSNYMYVWSKGGKRMVFPEDVGHPFPDKLGENNYYMIEVHYDNPEMLTGQRFKTGGRVSYTKTLRGTDAGMLMVGHNVGISLTVPPNQEDFLISGHCSSYCTQQLVPEGGLKVFNSLLHSHLSGRKLRVRHIRGNVELPWLDYDDHYDFNFQQNKPLREPVELRKGDHLTVECTYSSGWNKGSIVVGGLSTREEMCYAFLWYYPQQNVSDQCLSEYPVDSLLENFGVEKFTQGQAESGVPLFTIVKPDSLAGEYVDSMSKKFVWTEDFLRDYQHNKTFGEHDSTCVSGAERTKFPENIQIYVPQDGCQRGGGASTLLQSPILIIAFTLLKLSFEIGRVCL